MISELKHSKCLSKRYKRDFNFKSTLFPKLKEYFEIDKGVWQAKYIKDYESILSEIEYSDTDNEYDKLLDEVVDSNLLPLVRQINKDDIESEKAEKIKEISSKIVYNNYKYQRTKPDQQSQVSRIHVSTRFKNLYGFYRTRNKNV